MDDSDDVEQAAGSMAARARRACARVLVCLLVRGNQRPAHQRFRHIGRVGPAVSFSGHAALDAVPVAKNGP
jgi:hypothetical protein